MQLLGAEKYQFEALPKLEAAVEEQVSKNAYSLEVNLAVLRLYHIAPSTAKPAIVVKILLKAMMQLPNPDFKSCVHLLSERLQTEDKVAKIIQLASALETTRFGDFWSLASGCKDQLSSVPGFSDAVRENIIHLLGITFQRMHKAVLASYLNLTPPEIDAMVKARTSDGWRVQSSPSGELVCLPKNDLNTTVVKRTQDVIRLDQVAPVLRSVTVGFY